MRARRHAFVWGGLLFWAGCVASHKMVTMPSDEPLVRDQLVIFSDFRLPRHHRLVEELVALRGDIVERLRVPVSDEPIHVHLFDSPARYQAFIAERFPQFPSRRAFFVESDTRLSIYAYWGERVAEDLRHEVAHGYLHAMVPRIPLWIDEGLAEYYEVPRGHRGLNRSHLELLREAMAQQRWAPDMARLEQLQLPDEMTQEHYAEAWAWMHLLLESTPERCEVLRNYLARLRMTGSAPPLWQTLAAVEPLYQRSLVDHLLLHVAGTVAGVGQ